jgi:hypothetical protein
MSSKSSTPTSGEFEGFPEVRPVDKIKKIKSSLNKITDRTFEKISEELLRFELLDNPSSEECIITDKDNMLPVIQAFISNICVFEHNDEAMTVQVKLFCKLKDKWIGRQGRILMEIMMSELSKFFKEYAELTEVDEKKRNSCFKLVKFVSLLYNENAVSMRLVVAILQTYRKNDKMHLEVFCKLFAACQKKLLSNTDFREKVLHNYKSYLEVSSKSTELDTMYRFMCQNILDEIK